MAMDGALLAFAVNNKGQELEGEEVLASIMIQIDRERVILSWQLANSKFGWHAMGLEKCCI